MRGAPLPATGLGAPAPPMTFGAMYATASLTAPASKNAANTPAHAWRANGEGRGVAWANSLFEDNAEFGLGYRLAIDQQGALARSLLTQLAGDVGADLADALLAGAQQQGEAALVAQRGRVALLRQRLAGIARPEARSLEAVADFLVRRSV